MPFLGNDHIELNYDSNKDREKARRDGVCPDNWKNQHQCPKAGNYGITQPPTVPKGAIFGSGSYPAARYIDPNTPGLGLGDIGNNRIATPLGTYLGMIWTCDEWPPAM